MRLGFMLGAPDCFCRLYFISNENDGEALGLPSFSRAEVRTKGKEKREEKKLNAVTTSIQSVCGS
jgi:hypothetical protein